MKKMLLTLLMGVLAVAGYAQARFDVHGGMSLANITNSDADLKVGYTVGVGMDYPIDNQLSFQTGLNITTKGGREKENGTTIKVNPIYLDIPFLAAWKMDISADNRLVLNAGPYLGIGLGGKMTEEAKGIETSSKLFSKVGGNEKSLMNPFAVGLQCGVGLELTDCYLLNLTGQYGVTNMFRKCYAGEHNRNLSLLLSVGFRF